MKSEFSLQEKRDFARNMRRNMTRAEQTLWWKLSHNHFGYRFCRQFPLRGYIVDFYCGQLRMVIEVDGSVHEDENVAANDEQRERILENYGFQVLRFSNEDVLDHLTVVLTRLWDECAARRIALKAFSLRSVVGKTKNLPETLNRSCGSVQKSSAPATVGKTSVDAAPRIPAGPEDYAAINRAWTNLVLCSRQRSLALNNTTLTTAAEVALDQKLRLQEYLQKKSVASELISTEPAALTVAKGMHVAEPVRRKA